MALSICDSGLDEVSRELGTDLPRAYQTLRAESDGIVLCRGLVENDSFGALDDFGAR